MSQSVTVATKSPKGAPAPAAAPVVGAPASAAAEPVVIEARALSKRFKIYKRPLDRLWEWTRLRRNLHTAFWAVKDVSFEVRRGRCLGIIGANGSGKSTLLKMLTGAMYPTEGSCRVEGRVLSLIELGTGLNPHLTGRQNIVNAATLLGFPVEYAREKMAEIEAFAELGEFFDRETALYSSGMRVRLAFSMFACFRPEVFMVDEALSVGDVFFQQKCAVRLRELLDAGMTMIFVSHDQSAVLNLCDEAILLQRGRAIFRGEPEEAVSRYMASVGEDGRPRNKWARAAASPGGAAAPGEPSPGRRSGSAASSSAAAIIQGDVLGPRAASRHGSGEVRIVAARFLDRAGRPTLQAMMGEALTIELLAEAVADIPAAQVGLHLYDRFNTIVFAAATHQAGDPLPPLRAGDRLIVRLELTMDVQPGQYTLGLGCSLPQEDDPDQGRVCDRITGLGPVIVVRDRARPRPFHGMAKLPLRASHEMVEPGA
jgi:lipopolysaccharide transport system ATP-binding protein